jgi:hypothetical protein
MLPSKSFHVEFWLTRLPVNSPAQKALAPSKLNHANIATVHHFDTQQAVDFLVMEYISRETLRSLT